MFRFTNVWATASLRVRLLRTMTARSGQWKSSLAVASTHIFNICGRVRAAMAGMVEATAEIEMSKKTSVAS